MRFLTISYIFVLLLPAPVQAEELQSLPAIKQAVENFVREKTAGQPGEFTVTASAVDPRLKLAKCTQLQPFLPPGGRLWGRSSVGVRCLAPTTWSLYVPVMIKVTQPVLVAIRPITSGQRIQAEDVELQTRDVTRYAGSVLTALEQTEGRTAAVPIPSGSLLRSEMLRAAKVIRQGQSVKLMAKGNGFTVSSEGQAMGNATAGEVVTVKTRSGQLVKGIARSEGVVEVTF